MKSVLKWIAKMILAAGLVSVVIFTCMIDNECFTFMNIIKAYAMSGFLLIIGAVLYKKSASVQEIEVYISQKVI